MPTFCMEELEFLLAEQQRLQKEVPVGVTMQLSIPPDEKGQLPVAAVILTQRANNGQEFKTPVVFNLDADHANAHKTLKARKAAFHQRAAAALMHLHQVAALNVSPNVHIIVQINMAADGDIRSILMDMISSNDNGGAADQLKQAVPAAMTLSNMASHPVGTSTHAAAKQ